MYSISRKCICVYWLVPCAGEQHEHTHMYSLRCICASVNTCIHPILNTHKYRNRNMKKTPPHPLPSLVGRAARGPSSPVPRLSRLCNPPRKPRKPNRMRIAACAWSGCECAASAQESSHTCTCTFSARAWGDGEHMIHAPGCLTSLVWSHQGAVLTVTYLNECIWVYLRCIWKMYLCALVSGCVFD